MKRDKEDWDERKKEIFRIIKVIRVTACTGYEQLDGISNCSSDAASLDAGKA